MNKFAKSGFALFIIAACTFAVALLFDQTNLLDIIYGNSELLLNQTNFEKQLIPPITKMVVPGKVQSFYKIIIVDEDSPITEAPSNYIFLLDQTFQTETTTSYTFTSFKSYLYLENRHLII